MPKPVYQKENLMLHCRKQKNTRRCTIKLVTTFSKQVFSYESRFCPSCRNIYNLKWAFRMSYKLFSPDITIKYISRYLERPILAISRIDAHNGDTVTFYSNILNPALSDTRSATLLTFKGQG